jgi:tetratricopeptide (TPR) repeat protein
MEAALHASTYSIEWGRILTNIGYTYLRLGELERARDVFLGIIATVSEPYETFMSHINLIDVYAAFDQREEIENVRRYLEARALPPAMAVDFQLTLGRAYSKLGDAESARPCFETAEALAHRVGIGRGVIEADRALAELPHSSRVDGFQSSRPTESLALDSRKHSTTPPRLSSRLHQ